MDPFTIALIVGVVVTIVAAGVTAYSQYAQARAASNAARYNAQAAQYEADFNQRIAEYNAQLMEAQGEREAMFAEAQAESIRQQGAFQEEQIRRQTMRLQGEARANIGAAGITTEGSPLLVLMENARESEMDVQRLQYGVSLDQYTARTEGVLKRASAFRQAEGIRLGAESAGFGASLYAGQQRRAAGAYMRAGYLGAGSSLLAGVGSAAGSFYSGYRSGAFGGGGSASGPRSYGGGSYGAS